MTAPADPQLYLDQVMSRLTGPGAPFEIAEEEVLGTTMPVMKTRGHAVGELVRDSLRWGDRDYLVTTTRRISFTEHHAQVAALATALRERYGIRKGDRVAILAANSPEWVSVYFATQALGAIAVGLNGWWVPREVDYALRHSTPSIVVADAKRAQTLAAVGTDIPILTIEEDIARLTTEFAGAELPREDVDEDDPSTILYTSGTSGRPKGALHSHRNLMAVVDYHRFSDALGAAFTGREYDPSRPSPLRYLLTSPLFHIASLHNLVVPRLATGGAVVINEGSFDVDTVLGLIERERVTNWGAVPTMAARLLEHPDVDKYDLSSLTAFALASAPSSVAFKERLKARFTFARDALVDSYGLTECSTAIAVAAGPELEHFPGTLGRPIITVSLEIRDEFDEWLPDGEEGQVCVRSPFVMLGYWNDDAATEAAIAPGRWLRTGDYGVVEDGRLRLTGRRSDLILRGGENVYPTEIEQCLDEHPAVSECAVIGSPHPDLGQEVCAVVVLREGADVTEDELQAFAKERLSYFKVPSRWRITRDHLPRNATGKMMRREISV
ncbi:acyl--CoA ligase [Rhodococcus triatomae]|uniref:Acyl-CoA synthetase (AMP-forming)/AMP-acid ligase II n=1 Tax=Rhodococcus triatomae TaxID=300028 RepID=A0A1G7ZUZ7_9NOCA|nr:class I adenylate-forming enzyme family protein [Rhodococcus triatomae]QNG17939.1 acyl--CoA ligase [Rhodococcus triatomae]QNG22392.1 acyl--CoA ligase [Rhodococcus triatomae]SDH12525.1 Acyl-CoA synthetase (AMP-forming)/AMP-acid ligase II [Rhodococcus triatomae]